MVPAAHHETAGFTIVEAVVLISVIGILAAVSAPRFLAIGDMDAIRAHRQALADLRFAQRRAATSGCPVQVDFDADGYELRQRTGCRAGPFTRAIVDPALRTSSFVVELPVGVTLTSTVDPLVFDSLGRATNASGGVMDVAITLGARSLEAVGETGLVRVP